MPEAATGMNRWAQTVVGSAGISYGSVIKAAGYIDRADRSWRACPRGNQPTGLYRNGKIQEYWTGIVGIAQFFPMDESTLETRRSTPKSSRWMLR